MSQTNVIFTDLKERKGRFSMLFLSLKIVFNCYLMLIYSSLVLIHDISDLFNSHFYKTVFDNLHFRTVFDILQDKMCKSLILND